MSSKINSPWDADVARALAAYYLSYGVSEALHMDIVALMGKAYSKGHAAGVRTEREYPNTGN